MIAGKIERPSKDKDVEKGEGKVIVVDGKKVGAYRDDGPAVHPLEFGHDVNIITRLTKEDF